MLDTIAAIAYPTGESFAAAMATVARGGSALRYWSSGIDTHGPEGRVVARDHHANLGGIRVTLREGEATVRLEPFSLPALLHGTNARLLSPKEVTAAVDHVDEVLAPLGLPSVRTFRLLRADLAHDFKVDPAAVPAYLRNLALRELRQPGPPVRMHAYPGETCYWGNRKGGVQVTIYDKHAEVASRSGSPADPTLRGTLRYEVRLRRRACDRLADALLTAGDDRHGGLLRKGYLPLAALLDPSVAHRVLCRYADRLGLGEDIARGAGAESGPVTGQRAHGQLLARLLHLKEEGLTDEELTRWLGSLGYRRPRATLGRLLGEIRRAGVVPAPAGSGTLPGLRLPSLEHYVAGDANLEPEAGA